MAEQIGSIRLDQTKAMRLMFTAYREVLSAYGREMSVRFNSNAQMSRLMPDPHNIDIKTGGNKNWFRWFDRSLIRVSDDSGFSRGCLEPCQQCGAVERNFRTLLRPLPANLQMILDYGWSFFNVSDPFGGLLDPFFGVRVDGLMKFCLDHHPSEQIRLTTRGWEEDDPDTQDSAERINAMAQEGSDIKFILSFHLGHPRYDIIRDIHLNNGKEVSQELIDTYARRYANVMQTLQGRWQAVHLFGTEGSDLYNRALASVFEKTFTMLGADEFDIRKALPLITNMRSAEQFSVGGFPVQLNRINYLGNGQDFLERLEKCKEPDASYPEAGRTKMTSCLWGTDEEFMSRNRPCVELRNSGKIIVHGVDPEITTLECDLKDLTEQ